MAIVTSRKKNKYQIRYFGSIKEGDKLRVRSIDWYNQNKQTEGPYVGCIVPRNKRNEIFASGMSTLCGKVLTVAKTSEDSARWSTRTFEDRIENVIMVKDKVHQPTTEENYCGCVDPAVCVWHDWMFEGGPDIP